MNKDSFYASRLKILYSLMAIQVEIISISKNSKDPILGDEIKTLIATSKLFQQSEYLKKLQEKIRKIEPKSIPNKF